MGRGSDIEEKVKSAKGLTGVCDLPGSVEISLMALASGSASKGVSTIQRCSAAPVILEFEAVLNEIGIHSSRTGETVEVTGGALEEPKHSLSAGSHPIYFSCLAGLLAGAPFQTELISGHSENLARGTIKALQSLGAAFSLPVEGTFPLKLGGGKLTTGRHVIQSPDSGIKSALFLAGLGVEGVVELVQDTSGEDDLEVLFRRSKCRIEKGRVEDGEGHQLSISGPLELKAAEHELPGEAGAAIVLLLTAAVLGRSDLTVKHVGVDLKSRRMMDLLRRMNVKFELKRTQTESKFHTRQIQVKGSELRSVKISNEYSRLFLNELPLLAVIGASSPGETIIRDAALLREGPVDCISVLVENLREMGIQVGEMPDGLVIKGGRLQGTTVDAKGDARIGLAMISGGFAADGETTVVNPGPVREHYPGVLERLGSLERV